VRLHRPARGVAPGQAIGLYDDTRVIGSATIGAAPRTAARPASACPRGPRKDTGCVLGRPRASSAPGSPRPCQSSSGPRATVTGPRTRDTSLWAMTAEPHPWVAGSATGIGSHPGTDPREAAATVFGELPDLPYLPELPARG